MIKLFLLLLSCTCFISTLAFICSVPAADECVWEAEKIYGEESTNNAPVLFDKKTNKTILPNLNCKSEVSEISITEGQKFILTCGDHEFKDFRVTSVEVTCRNNRIRYRKKSYDLEKLECKKGVEHRVIQYDKKCGSDNRGDLNAIAIPIQSGLNYPTIEVCFDNKTKVPIHTKHLLRGAHIGASIMSQRPSFRKDTFYKKNPNKFYSKKSQKAVMQLLEIDPKTISGSTKYYARGHLTPDGDFATKPEVDLTYSYSNVHPQVQAINGGNYKLLEAAIRQLAEKLGSDLEITTGAFETLELENRHGKMVKIFLGNSKTLPPPKLIWKVVHEKSSGRAIAFVSSNNPQSKEDPIKEYAFKDICDQLDWTSLRDSKGELKELKEVKDGFVYCVTAKNLHEIVADAPDLGEVELLLERTVVKMEKIIAQPADTEYTTMSTDDYDNYYYYYDDPNDADWSPNAQ